MAKLRALAVTEEQKELLKPTITKTVLTKLKQEAKKVEIKQEDGTTKHAGGRPSKYDPSFCDTVIELASQGIGTEQACIRIGITMATMTNWMKKHPEFLNAIKISKKICMDWWLEIGRCNLFNKNFNNVLWMMNMSNRFNWKSSNSNIEKNVKKKVNYSFDVTPTSDKAKNIVRILDEAGVPEFKGTTKRVEAFLDSEVD